MTPFEELVHIITADRAYSASFLATYENKSDKRTRPFDDGRKRILVIDDDWDVRDSLAMVLEDVGYYVQTAANGVLAMNLITTEFTLSNGERVPDLILLDVMMPVMDGLQFYKWLRDRAHLSNIPIVIITAGSTSGIPWVVSLAKPFDLQALLDTVAREIR